MPLPERALTSIVLNCEGHTILFDCGEGTQSAARKAGVSLMKTEIIALTHYHGDHILGLPGLLQSMSCLGRTKDLLIVGPEGIPDAMGPIMELAGNLTFEVGVREIEEPIELFPEAVLTPVPTRHRCKSNGYIFTLDRAGVFDMEKAEALGVDKSDWGKLQHGEAVGDITPDMVLGEKRKGLKVVYSGDSLPCDNLTKAAEGADLFFCEATYATEDRQKKATEYGHMTFAQACDTGKGEKKTVLVHFSQMIEDPSVYSLPENCEAGKDGMKFELKFDSR